MFKEFEINLRAAGANHPPGGIGGKGAGDGAVFGVVGTILGDASIPQGVKLCRFGVFTGIGGGGGMGGPAVLVGVIGGNGGGGGIPDLSRGTTGIFF